ncbi:hypothetical protein VI817_007282 [Penicillium citrinum]|nr:hypothetical protein VI817_007282 [Penicillium citrinum]
MSEPFQKGETPTFISHAKAGIQALVKDPKGLLIFSGGPTKKPRTKVSEGGSYHNLCKDNDFFGYPIDTSKVITEIHATDSYQNILFSLIEFRLHVGVWPRRITVVTHEFKRRRFMNYHFPALGLLPPSTNSETGSPNVNLIGINPPEEVTPLESIIQGEMSMGIGLWKQDPYGVGEELAGKRNKRGWIPGMEENIFLNKGLEHAVEQLVCWNGEGKYAFPHIHELPWFYGNKEQ